MDGIHDLGGMHGFGVVVAEADEPVFHEDWEALAYGLNALALARLRAYNVDEYRHAIERMDPVHYLTASYYERLLTGVASLLVEKGVLTHQELERWAGGCFPLARPIAELPRVPLDPQPRPLFAVGSKVRVRNLHPAGHTRAPRYVRGKCGVVLHVAPRFPLPEAAAHGLAERSEHTYHVEFTAQELWPGEADAADSVVVDLWDSYLEPA